MARARMIGPALCGLLLAYAAVQMVAQGATLTGPAPVPHEQRLGQLRGHIVANGGAPIPKGRRRVTYLTGTVVVRDSRRRVVARPVIRNATDGFRLRVKPGIYRLTVRGCSSSQARVRARKTIFVTLSCQAI